MATKVPRRISLRVYPVGFGDCFLIGFHYAGNDDRFVLVDFGGIELTRKRMPKSAAFLDYMKKVADDIATRCGRKNGKGGQIHAVIATHRHADHINGFATRRNPRPPMYPAMSSVAQTPLRRPAVDRRPGPRPEGARSSESCRDRGCARVPPRCSRACSPPRPASSKRPFGSERSDC